MRIQFLSSALLNKNNQDQNNNQKEKESELNNNKEQSIIVLIHGFRTNSKTWPQTLFDFNPKWKFIIVDLNDQDYKQENLILCEEIHNRIMDILNPKIDSSSNSSISSISSSYSSNRIKITIMSHSQGGFYAMRLAEMFPDIYCKLLLIDPPAKTKNYKNYLLLQDEYQQLPQLNQNENNKQNEECSVERCKVNDFENLCSGLELKPSIPIWIHMNYETDTNLDQDIKDKFLERMIHYSKVVSRKEASTSRLMIHCNQNHFLHQKPSILSQILLSLNIINSSI